MSESIRPAFGVEPSSEHVSAFGTGGPEEVVSLMEALGIRVPKPAAPAATPPRAASEPPAAAPPVPSREPAVAAPEASLPPAPAVPSEAAAPQRRPSILPPPSISAPPIPDMPASKIGDSVLPPASMPPPMSSEALEAFTEAALSLASARDAALAASEDQLLDLAIVIAGAIVEQAIERVPELHGALVRKALDAVRGEKRARLRAAPEAYGVIVDQLGDTHTRHDGVDVEILEDASLRGLGCVVESEGTRVDGNLAERLREVRRQIDLARQSEEVDE